MCAKSVPSVPNDPDSYHIHPITPIQEILIPSRVREKSLVKNPSKIPHATDS